MTPLALSLSPRCICCVVLSWPQMFSVMLEYRKYLTGAQDAAATTATGAKFQKGAVRRKRGESVQYAEESDDSQIDQEDVDPEPGDDVSFKSACCITTKIFSGNTSCCLLRTPQHVVTGCSGTTVALLLVELIHTESK